jgi:inorganic triphosphatase YgiF
MNVDMPSREGPRISGKTAGQSHHEVEAKLLASESQLRAVARLREVGAYRLRRRDIVRLHSVYVDTADLTLARHGIALRLRRQAGRWELTAKWAGRVAGLVHERPEVTVPLSMPPRFPFQLDTGLQPSLKDLVADRPLRPILITQIHRRRIDVLPRTRGTRWPVAELALDRVRLRAPDARQAAAVYGEIEIERVKGTRHDVTRLAQVLQQRFDLTPSAASKFARGLALLYASDRVRQWSSVVAFKATSPDPSLGLCPTMVTCPAIRKPAR